MTDGLDALLGEILVDAYGVDEQLGAFETAFDDWVNGYARAWETANDELVASLFSEDASYRSSPFREPFRGHDEIRAFWQRLLDAFDEVRVELVDPVEVEEGLVVAENVAYQRGRDGIEVQARSAWLIAIRDGETTSFTMYQTKHDALEAAGLSE